MSFKYRTQSIPAPRGKDEPQYFPRLVSNGTVKTTDLMRIIQRQSTHTTADIKGALDAIAQVLSHSLSEGRRVHLDGIGYFTPVLASPRKHDAHIRANHVRIGGVAFRPEKQLCRRLLEAHGEPVADLLRESEPTAAEIEALVIEHFRTHPVITRRDLQSLTGLRRTKALVALRRLLADGVIKNCGSSRHPVYVKGD